MDVCESEQAFRKYTAVDTQRLRLLLSEKNNAVTSRHSRTREVSSRYRSPTPTTLSESRRSPSPNLTRTVPTPSQLVPKRAQSVDRKRPCTPPSPPRPSTPAQDSSMDVQLLSRRIMGGRIPESLWPSTMRSLSVSFQSDTISIPVSKREKPVTGALSDRTLRLSSNVAHKQGELPCVARKSTPERKRAMPERKRSPLKGKNVSDQSENSKPVEGLHSRLIDQHRWPSRTGGKASSTALTRSVDFTDNTVRTSGTLAPGIGLSSLRRMPPSDGVAKPLQKSFSDATRRLSLDGNVRLGIEANSTDNNSLQVSGHHKLISTSSSDKLASTTPAVRNQSLPHPGSRPPSPSRTSVLSFSISRGGSPSRTRPLTPPSKGVSPSRIRPSTPSSHSSSSTSVLSFIVDFRKGKKGASYIEDAHQLRLLYNRRLRWRFANAQAEAVLYIQKVIAEGTLYNVWNITLALWDSVIRKRINLQQMKLELKLNSVLNGQMGYLDDWALLERDHISSLSAAVEDLEASTIRLPITGGARADIETLKVAVCSAVDVMQAMGSSMYSLLSRVEGMNSLVSELTVVAVQERTMLDECEALLTSAAAMQAEEYSLRTHLMQIKRNLEKGGQPIWAIKLPP